MATDWAAQLASYKKQYNTGDKSAAQRAQTLRQQAQAAGVDLNSLESQAMKLATGRDMTAEERGYANQYISKVKPPISTFTNPGLGDNGLGPLKGNEFWANMDNPEFQQAEVNRVNQVIANRKAQGLDTGQQESWLRQVTSHQPKVKPVVMGTPSPAMPLVITQQSTPRPAMAPGIAWQDALQRSRSQVDPLRQESIRNLMERYQQNRQETDQIAQARGGLHSGLIADQLTKLAQGLMQSQASINAKYDSDIARLAQTIQERNEDVNYRDWMAKNQFYDSDRNFGYQQQRDARRDFESDRGFGLQEAGLTGVYNGAPTLEAQNIRFNQGIQEGQLTGNYIPSAARDIITQILAAKQANATGGNAEAAAKANQLRAMLPQYGIDPSLFGADVTYEQALQNIGRAGQQTLAKQGQEFSQGIQMAQLTGFLPDGTPTNAYQQQQLANAWKEADAFGYVTPALSQLTGIPVGTETLQAKQIAIAQQNANTSAARLNMPSATEERNAAMSEAISNIDQMTPEARKQFFQEQRAALINEFGLPGYNQLYNMYFDQYGDPKENPSKPTSYAPSSVSGLIQSTASKYGVNPSLASAVARAESGYDQSAKSPKGAIGVFQLMPGTASDLGVNPNDLAQNIEGGIKYLAQQLRAFGGDIQKALAAYNWGPGNVQNAVKNFGSNWLAHAPSETRNYVAKIMSMIS